MSDVAAALTVNGIDTTWPSQRDKTVLRLDVSATQSGEAKSWTDDELQQVARNGYRYFAQARKRAGEPRPNHCTVKVFDPGGVERADYGR